MLYPVAIVYDEFEQLASVSCISYNGSSFRRISVSPDTGIPNYEFDVYKHRLRGTSAIEIYKNDSLVSKPCYQPISKTKERVLLASGSNVFWTIPSKVASDNLNVANLGDKFIADASLLPRDDIYRFMANSPLDLINPKLFEAKYISLTISKNASIQNLILPENVYDLISGANLTGLYCSDKSRMLYIDARAETFIAPPVCCVLVVKITGTVATLPKLMQPLFPRDQSYLSFHAAKAVLTVDQRAYSKHLFHNDIEISACVDNQAYLRFASTVNFSCSQFPQYLEIFGNSLVASCMSFTGNSNRPVHIYFDNITAETLDITFTLGYSAPKTFLHFRDTCKIERLELSGSDERLVIQIDNVYKRFKRLLIEDCYVIGKLNANNVFIYRSALDFNIQNVDTLYAGNDFNSFYLEEYSGVVNGSDTNFLAALRDKETGTFVFPDKQKAIQPSVSFFVNKVFI